MIDAIRDTATALSDRLFVVETLGGHTGHLAVALAFAAQADAVCVPEFEIDAAAVGKKLAEAAEQRGYGLCIVCEGIGNVPEFCNVLTETAGYRVRLTSMGHAQRGGSPSFFDRWLARVWAELAVTQLLDGVSGQMLAWQMAAVDTIPLANVFTAPPKAIDQDRYGQINGN
jgi:6-phosphofructokinase 1